MSPTLESFEEMFDMSAMLKSESDDEEVIAALKEDMRNMSIVTQHAIKIMNLMIERNNFLEGQLAVKAHLNEAMKAFICDLRDHAGEAPPQGCICGCGCCSDYLKPDKEKPVGRKLYQSQGQGGQSQEKFKSKGQSDQDRPCDDSAIQGEDVVDDAHIGNSSANVRRNVLVARRAQSKRLDGRNNPQAKKIWDFQEEVLNENVKKNFQKIFNYLDQKSLGNCRLVCRAWNKISIPVYSKIWVDFGLFYMRSLDPEYLLKKADEIQSTFSKAPEGLIGKLQMQFELLRTKTIRSWFQLCGPQLTSLNIKGPFVKEELYSTFIMCPNLEFFGIINLNGPLGKVQESCRVHFPSDLKLKTITLTGDKGIPIGEYTDSQVDFFIDLVGSSPLLENLTLSFGDRYGSFARFITGITPFYHITKNLVRLVLGNNEFMPPFSRNLHVFRNMQFSPKLKSLLIRDFCDEYFQIGIGTGYSFMTTSLNALLFSNRNSIETLTLVGNYSALASTTMPLIGGTPFHPQARLVDFSHFSDEEIRIPFMGNLKIFENWAMHSFHMYSLDFIKCLPKLEKLVLSALPAEKFRLFFKHPGSVAMMQSPHKSVTTLTLAQEVTDVQTIDICQKALPNLKRLRIGIGSGFLHEFGFADGRFLGIILRELQEFKFLTKLTLDFFHFYDGQLDISLKNLLNFSKLTALELVCHVKNMKTTSFDMGQPICIDTITEIFFSMKSLRWLTFSQFHFTLEDATELTKIATEKNIILKFEDKVTIYW